MRGDESIYWNLAKSSLRWLLLAGACDQYRRASARNGVHASGTRSSIIDDRETTCNHIIQETRCLGTCRRSLLTSMNI